MIVTEEQALKAFEFLKQTEQEHAQATADHDALKKHENALIAKLKFQSVEKTSAAKEDEAYNSPEYAQWESGMKEANYILTLLENKRDRARTALDLWRTASANERRL